jgi:CheY-like chemotaxis protein
VIRGFPKAEVEPRPPRTAPASATSLEVEIEGVRILVVDDEKDARELLKRILEDFHAIVTAVKSADDAIEVLRGGKFDVLVSDIGMPGEDGYSLIRRVRSLSADCGGHIPAIALTAYARGEDRIKAVAAGFQMHIVKPVEARELITMIAGARSLSVVSPPRKL